MGHSFDKRVAECVGLWLAEGDNKTHSEITFTNNCWKLIGLFERTINRLFWDQEYNQRIYVYSPTKEHKKIDANCMVKYYVHKRATKPYFIFRIASRELIKNWKTIVINFLNDKDLSEYILRGFFAGEGNVHIGKRNVRTLRISQGKRKEFIESLLKDLGITFHYTQENRNYVINKKSNWDVFARFKLADLHPDKKEKFWKNYNFQQEHYSKKVLSKKIYSLLERPYTARELSDKLGRSFARIQDVLIELKKEKRINHFRVKSKGHWTRDKNLIIISKLKKDYLFLLDIPRKTSYLADNFGVCWKSSFRRLKELEKLNLVERQKDGKWMRVKTCKKILAI